MCCRPIPRRLPPQLPFRPSAIWKRATKGRTSAVNFTTAGSSLKIFAKWSLEIMRMASMMVPTMMLSKAAVLAALAAVFASLAPRRLPTLALAATPMPKGMVFMISSEVMITLWAARGMVPSRPAARATISNAHHSVPTWMTPRKARRANVPMWWTQRRDQPPHADQPWT